MKKINPVYKILKPAIDKCVDRIADTIDEEIYSFHKEKSMRQSTQTDNIIFPETKDHRIVKERRLGKFLIPRSILYSGQAKVVFEEAIIIRCELLAIEDRFEYFAYHWQFRSISLGELIPTYSPIIQTTDDPTVDILSFEEVK